ncbi:MAG: OPT family oligopeptide transporter, partial [Planctomycetota bacterium]
MNPTGQGHERGPEFTLRAILTGTALGLVFGASSLYLVLKVGLTVSASIPVAVLAITLFRVLESIGLTRRTRVLENNIIQTAGSAGESIAFGVGVTMPGLMLIGFDLDLPRVMIVSLLGGVLGILMMIPLRRLFIVQMHGKAGQPGTLLYPEGTACAKVLESGEKDGGQGGAVFIGFMVAIVHKFVTEGMGLLRSGVELPLTQFSRVARITGDLATELLGVGDIIGLRISALMLAGSVLGALVIVPAVAFFGDGRPDVLAPATKPIGILQAGDIEKTYLRFLGAGCVAAAGVFSMIKTLPLILGAALSTLRRSKGSADGSASSLDPRERDLPPAFVWGGLLVLLGGLTAFLAPEVGVWAALTGAFLVLVFGFLFVTVSSRLTGEIGSSSNPISGMTI